MKRFVLAALMLFGLVAPIWAGFDEGVAAYERGDYAAAFHEFRPLAEQGVASAQNNLGAMYGNGQGVPQDYVQAMKWFRKAAEQGHASAQNNLGISYGKGQGVLEDYVQAHMWLTLAAAQGHKRAKSNRDIIAAKMTPAQIAAAQKLAREWKPR